MGRKVGSESKVVRYEHGKVGSKSKNVRYMVKKDLKAGTLDQYEVGMATLFSCSASVRQNFIWASKCFESLICPKRKSRKL